MVAQNKQSIEEAMLFLAQRICRETSRHCRHSLLAKIAPVLPSSVQDGFVKERQDIVWNLGAMGISTRKSSRNKTSNKHQNAVDIDAGKQVHVPFSMSAPRRLRHSFQLQYESTDFGVSWKCYRSGSNCTLESLQK